MKQTSAALAILLALTSLLTGCSQGGGGSKPQVSSASSVQAEPDDVDEADEYLSNQPLYHMTPDEVKKMDAQVDEIVKNPQVAAGSKPEKYIEAKSDVYHQIVALGEKALPYLLSDLSWNISMEKGVIEYVLASLCADITGKFNGPNKTWSTGKEWRILYKSIPWEQLKPKDMELPTPNAKWFSQYDGTIYCNGTVESDLEAYMRLLAQQGWQQILYQADSMPRAYSPYVFAKGSTTIQIVDQNDLYGYRDYNYFSMQITQFYNQSIIRKNALSLDKASKIITDYERLGAKKQDLSSTRKIKAVFEYNVPGLSKVKIQLYRVYYDGDGYDDFWISSTGDKIGPSYGLQNAIIADIDNDGKYELITCSIIGSGNMELVLNAYRYTDNLALAYNGVWSLNGDATWSNLTIKKQGKSGIHLWDICKLPYKELKTADYGLLNFRNGKVTIQQGIDFPFARVDQARFVY